MWRPSTPGMENQGRQARRSQCRSHCAAAEGACFSCHGEGFSKPIDPSYPKVAGQYSDYVFRALQSYKTESNPLIGRSNGNGRHCQAIQE